MNEAFLIYSTVVTAPLKIEPADFDVWMDAASDPAEVIEPSGLIGSKSHDPQIECLTSHD